MPRGAWATALLLVVAGVNAPARAQPLAPTGGPPPDATAPEEALPPAATPVPLHASAPRTAAIPDRPPSILGAPVAVPGLPARTAVDPAPSAAPERPTTPPPATAPIPATFSEPAAPTKVTRAAGLGLPTSARGDAPAPAELIPAGAVESRGKASAPAGPPALDPVNDFLARRTGFKSEGGKTEPYRTDLEPEPDPSARKPGRGTRTAGKFGDRLDGVFGERGEWFRSDHVFDGFISPVTNPFLFEDPRSLTEVRPLFIYQRIPNGQRDFLGGNVSYFGVQGRLAITDRLSFVVNKLGGIWLNPNSSSPVDGQSGFAELWFGPKFTFIRNVDTGSLLAGGLQFQVPVGSKGAFQDTGSLSLVPYASYAQSLFRDFRFGTVNTMATAGYAFSTTKARSDYLFLSGHVDLDVMNWHRFYPLFEMNYFLNTTNGDTYPIGSEGRDLFNFGGQASGNGLLTGAFGARFKITESAQIGGAFEIPFAGPRDLFKYRFTLDFILRY